MEREKYTETLCQLRVLATVVKDMPLKEFLNAISMADSLGPVLDPSLWKAGRANMNEVETLAQAAFKFQGAIRQMAKAAVSAEAVA